MDILQKEIRVLMVSKYSNPYVDELIDGLAKRGIIVEKSVDKFWKVSGRYDIVHMQWPEELFSNSSPDNEQLLSLEKCLSEWREEAKIVATRHNILPNRFDAVCFETIYSFLYSNVDAVIHLGNYSLSHLSVDKPNLLNTVIPHHIYTTYPNTVNKKESRRKFGLSEKSKVILCFGEMRTDIEREFIKDTAEKLDLPNSYFLVPRYFPSDYKVNSNTTILKRILSVVQKRLFGPKRIIVGNRFISKNEVQSYFNAADVVFIPRGTKNLNSGVVFLAMAFDKIVVGPSVGNISEVLNKSRGFQYERNDSTSAAAGLKKAILYALENEKYSYDVSTIDNFSLDLALDKHINLYQQLICLPRAADKLD